MSDLGNRDVMASNIQYYMDIRKKSRMDMCEVLGVAYTTFCDWVNAKTYPRIDKIERMANYFGIEKSDLVERRGRPKPKGVKIPVLGRVQAGVPMEAVEEILDYEEITQELAATGDFFALQIRGDSMEPRMREGDVVIVRKQEDADTGQTVVVLINGDDATVKRLKKHEDGSISLLPTNQAYDPLFYSRKEVTQLPVAVLGRVVELRAKF